MCLQGLPPTRYALSGQLDSAGQAASLNAVQRRTSLTAEPDLTTVSGASFRGTSCLFLSEEPCTDFCVCQCQSEKVLHLHVGLRSASC